MHCHKANRAVSLAREFWRYVFFLGQWHTHTHAHTLTHHSCFPACSFNSWLQSCFSGPATPYESLRRLLPWRPPLCPWAAPVWPVISSESATHLHYTSFWQDMSHMGSHWSRTYSEQSCGWCVVDVCVFTLQRRLSDGCVLEAPWDYTPVWNLDVRLSLNRAPHPAARTPAANIILTSHSKMVQVWITVSLLLAISLPAPLRPSPLQK